MACFPLFSFFFFYCYGDHRDLHSFPTRRSSDLLLGAMPHAETRAVIFPPDRPGQSAVAHEDRKSTRLNSSHRTISYAVFCLKKKKNKHTQPTPRDTSTVLRTSQCITHTDRVSRA